MPDNSKLYNQVKAKQRVADYGEVFTPQYIVEQMVDLIPDLRIETTVLEPSVGEGVFLCEILKRKLRLIANDKLRITEALQSIYGIDIMLDNVRKTRENLLAVCVSTTPNDGHTVAVPVETTAEYAIWQGIIEKNIRWGDTLACFEAKTEDDKIFLCLNDLSEKEVQELQFFNYRTNKWEKFLDSFRRDRAMIDEIVLRRNEYRTVIQQNTLF